MSSSSVEQEILSLRAKTEEELIASREERQRLEEENYMKELHILELEREIAGFEQEKSFGSIASLSATELSIFRQAKYPSASPSSPRRVQRRWSLSKSPSSPESEKADSKKGRRHSSSWRGPTKLDDENEVLEYLSWIEHGTKIILEHSKKELTCREEQVTALEITSLAQEDAIYKCRDKLLVVRGNKASHSGSRGDQIVFEKDETDDQTLALTTQMEEASELSTQIEADLRCLRKLRELPKADTLCEMEVIRDEMVETRRKMESTEKEHETNLALVRQHLETEKSKLSLIEIHLGIMKRVGMRSLQRMEKKALSGDDPQQLSTILLRAVHALDEELEIRRPHSDTEVSRLVHAATAVTRQSEARLCCIQALMSLIESLPDDSCWRSDMLDRLQVASGRDDASFVTVLDHLEGVMCIAVSEYAKDKTLLSTHLEVPVEDRVAEASREDAYDQLIDLKTQLAKTEDEYESQEASVQALTRILEGVQKKYKDENGTLGARIEHLKKTTEQQTKLWDSKDQELKLKLEEVKSVKHRTEQLREVLKHLPGHQL